MSHIINVGVLCLLPGRPVITLCDLRWKQPWWYRTTPSQQPPLLRYAFWSGLRVTGRSDRPRIRTGLPHRSSLWLSARQSTPRPGREYWAAPAQRRRLRTNPTLTRQGAITLHCLQRTPDQTITLSGSQPAQTAPKGSGSTNKKALRPPNTWGERDQEPPEQRQRFILQTAFLQLHYIGWAARNHRRKWVGNVLSSPLTRVCLTLW